MKQALTQEIVIIKVGTNTLVQKLASRKEILSKDVFESIASQVLQLRKNGTQVILVSSAAITAGIIATKLSKRPSGNSAIPELQRLASVGWRHILNHWQESFGNLVIGELLLTKYELSRDLTERDEALRTIYTLLSHGDLPIINENDAITHEEISFGDNDMLAANLAVQITNSPLFASKVKLILLTDVNGLYRDKNDAYTVIRKVDDVNKYKHLADNTVSQNSRGGIKSKLDAADLVTSKGVVMIIANGIAPDSILRSLKGEIGTTFIAK